MRYRLADTFLSVDCPSRSFSSSYADLLVTLKTESAPCSKLSLIIGFLINTSAILLLYLSIISLKIFTF